MVRAATLPPPSEEAGYARELWGRTVTGRGAIGHLHNAWDVVQLPERKVIYLTGPPASGKSSLAGALQASFGANVYSYGALLTSRIAAARDRTGLRSRSAELVQASDVEDLDLGPVRRVRTSSADLVVIDSHAVTKEAWGFRAIPYSSAGISGLGITHILCLYAPAEMIVERIAQDSGSRPTPERFEVEVHQQLQNSLALAYSHTLGVPIHFVANVGELESALSAVATCCDLAVA